MNAQHKRNVLNVVLFQLAWFVCVQGRDGWALGVVCVVLLLHGFFMVQNLREWWLLLCVTVLGFVIDSVLIRFGVLLPRDNAAWAPLWLVCLWLMLATTLLHSLCWLQSRLLLAALLGSVAGPLSYVAGAQFGAARLGDGVFFGAPMAIVVLSLCWAVVMPLLVWLAQRLVPPREVSA